VKTKMKVRPVMDELFKEELALKLYPGSVINLDEDEVETSGTKHSKTCQDALECLVQEFCPGSVINLNEEEVPPPPSLQRSGVRGFRC
jgi:hypothetical protein